MAKPDPTARIVVEHLATVDRPYPRHRPQTLSILGPLIYIGTQSGSLQLFSLDSSSSGRPVSLIRSLSFGYCPIDAVVLLPEVEKVLVLCDGSVFFTDSQLTQFIRKINFVKGVTFIVKRFRSLDPSESSNFSDIIGVSSGANAENFSILKKLGGGVRVNGGVKVKARDKELEHDRCSDGSGKNALDKGSNDYLFALLVGKKLMLVLLVFEGDGNEASLVVLNEIPCVEDVKTLVWFNDSIVVGTANGYTMFSCLTGQSGLIFTLPDVTSASLVTLLKKEKKILLLVDNVGVLADDHGRPVGGSLVFRRIPEYVQELSSYVCVIKDGKMELYQTTSGTCVQSFIFGLEEVGPSIIATEETGLGQMVAVVTPTKIICYRKVAYEDQIKDLLRKKKFKDVVTLVEELECDGELSSEMRSFVHAQIGFLLLFDLHFEQAVDQFLLSETMQPSELFPFIMRDPNRWTLLVPRNRYWGLHPPPAPLQDIIDDGLLSIQRAIFLHKAGVESTVVEEFVSNPPTKPELLELAIKNIIRYFELSRQKELISTVREGVDTLLMYLYRTLNRVDDMEKLASSENSCVVEDLESLLKESGHLRTLAFLYSSKGIRAKALDIWHSLAKKSYSCLSKDSGMSEGSTNTSLSVRDIAAIEAKKILEKSSDQNLVLHHLGWVAEVNPLHAVHVLTSEQRENQLSPDEVIATIDSKNSQILQRYLQWLIDDQDCNDSRFHTLYGLSLAKSAVEAIELGDTTQTEDLKRLERAKFCESGLNLEGSVRERLQIFLQSSDLYDAEEVLELIDGSELWLEKAILHRKLGHEKLVLQILALKLEDCDAAEQYCSEIGRPDAYMQLLDMYLDPQNGREPMFNAAVKLLHSHGELLDPLQVLETLSPEIPLKLAADTILRMLRARSHHYHQGKIVHNLSRAVYVDAKLARLDERGRHVQINSESLCDSCHARLGTKLFAMYPDDTVVCYKCFRRLGDSVSVSGRDFMRDIIFKPGWLVTR